MKPDYIISNEHESINIKHKKTVFALLASIMNIHVPDMIGMEHNWVIQAKLSSQHQIVQQTITKPQCHP